MAMASQEKGAVLMDAEGGLSRWKAAWRAFA